MVAAMTSEAVFSSLLAAWARAGEGLEDGDTSASTPIRLIYKVFVILGVISVPGWGQISSTGRQFQGSSRGL
jgi:hypothetical protein